jgi:hypothetical protein
MRDGRTLSALVEIPRGGADQPFDEATLIAKLARHTADALPNAASILGEVIRGEKAALDRGWRATVNAFTDGTRA